MSLKNKIQELITGYIVAAWPLPEHKPSGKPVYVNDDRTVLVFNVSSGEELCIIKDFLTDAKKHLNFSAVLAFSSCTNININEADDSVFIVSCNDFNLFGRIKHRLSNWLTNNNFDLLISFADENELLCNKMISSTVSGFKAGIYHQETVNLFDLTIKQETENFDKQLELFTHYLNKLNINI